MPLALLMVMGHPESYLKCTKLYILWMTHYILRERTDKDKENDTVSTTIDKVRKKLGRPRANNGRVCPRCGSREINRLGFHNGKRHGFEQRYICVECKRTFY